MEITQMMALLPILGLAKRVSSAVPPAVWLAGAVLLGGLLYGHLRYKAGAAEVTARWEAAAAAESTRQADINRRAQEEILRLNADHLKALSVTDKQVQELIVEAQRDPSAGSVSLGVDSVRRLDSIH